MKKILSEVLVTKATNLDYACPKFLNWIYEDKEKDLRGSNYPFCPAETSCCRKESICIRKTDAMFLSSNCVSY